MRTYTGVLRYSSFSDLLRIGVANLIGIVLGIALVWIISQLFPSNIVPIGIIGLLFALLLATLVMFGTRIFMKYLFDSIREGRGLRRVFIYGTKAGGVALAKSIRVEHHRSSILKRLSLRL